MTITRALVVEDEPDIRQSIVRQVLRVPVTEVFEQDSAEGALDVMRRHQVDVVLLDLGLPDRDGNELITALLAIDPEVRIVVLTGRDGARDAVRALEAGARAYLVKPCDREELAVVVRRVIEERQLRSQVELARRLASSGTSLAPCRSASWQRVVAMATDVAQTSQAHVMLRGESGVGKEVVARIIHAASARASAPFVASNVASLPASLIESELFGYEAGAFSGARATRRGLFELASRGTLFLDEIGEMPLELQARLLRVLEGQPFRRLGGEREIAVDVRVLSATHRELERMVGERSFRADLLYRLRVIELVIPPLRDRPEDVASLADYFASQIAMMSGRPRLVVTAAARARLERYAWPGNVRELRNVIERGAVLARDGQLDVAHLPQEIANAALSLPSESIPDLAARVAGGERASPEDTDLRLESAVERHITATWNLCAHNLSRTARSLQMSRTALRKRLRAYGLVEATADLPHTADETGDLPTTTADLALDTGDPLDTDEPAPTRPTGPSGSTHAH